MSYNFVQSIAEAIEALRTRLTATILITMLLGGCAHPAKTADSIPHVPVIDARREALNAIVAHWVRKNPDRKIFRYIDPELCALPIVSKLRREGFMIFSKDEPRPPRNSWDTDESRSWYDLQISEIEIKKDGGAAAVKTSWNGGFHVERYSLSTESGRWFVARSETLVIT